MVKLDPRIEEIRKTYSLQTDDFWEIRQKPGTWVAKHAALETVAAKAGVTFMPPQIIERDAEKRICSMVVEGRLEDGRTEWATGETNATNYKVTGNQPAYPWAMAEKRAKDRVILKLVGLHGLVYSEDEGDFTMSKVQTRNDFESLNADLQQITSLPELGRWWKNDDVQQILKSMKPDWQQQIIVAKDSKKRELENTPPDDGFPGDIPPEMQEAANNLRAG